MIEGTGLTEPPSEGSGHVGKKLVCKDRTNTLPAFVPYQLIHQKTISHADGV